MGKLVKTIGISLLISTGVLACNPAAHADYELSRAENELLKTQEELTILYEQIKRVEQAIEDNNRMIRNTENEIDELENEMERFQEDVGKMEEKIKMRSVIIEERMRALQQTDGNQQYIDLLLGSSSFGDLISRINFVSTIIKSDKDLMEEHKKDVEEMEEKQKQIEKKLVKAKSSKIELEGMQSQIMDQKQQNEQLKKTLQKREKEQLVTRERTTKEIPTQSVVLHAKAEKTAIENNGKAPGPVRQSSGSAVSVVMTAGNKYIGNSVYVFGGGRSANDVANGRFDCSGFVHWAFSQAGIKVGASTDSLKHAGKQIPENQLAPGDLVFFDTYKKDGHVGIYVGNGKFIGSQSSTGVAITSLTSGYWKRAFNGRVVRVL